MGRHGPHGSLRVEERQKGRVWVATIDGGKSGRFRKTLGPAWVRDRGRKTDRGATIWMAGAGTKPDETYLTPADAQQRLDELLAAEGATTASKPRQGMTWGAVWDAWLDDVEHRARRAPNTVRGYKSYGTRMDAEGLFPRDLPARRVDAAHIEQAQTRMLRDGELTDKTIHNRLLSIKAAHTFGVRKGWLKPLEDANLIAAPAPTEDFNVLTPEQVEAIARVVETIAEEDKPRVRGGRDVSVEDRAIHQATLELMIFRRKVWAAAIRFSAYTGLRMGEIRALEWRDLNIAGESARIVGNLPTADRLPQEGKRRKVTKSKRGRGIPLIAPAIVLLDGLETTLQDAGHPTGGHSRVFPSTTGNPLDIPSLRRAFYDALNDKSVRLGWMRSKDNPIVLHDLRHTFATLAAQVVPLHDLQAYLGHADIRTTMKYAHHVHRQEDAARLTRAFVPPIVEPEGSDLPAAGTSR